LLLFPEISHFRRYDEALVETLFPAANPKAELFFDPSHMSSCLLVGLLIAIGVVSRTDELVD